MKTALWTWDGSLDRLHHALYVQCREQAGREASPTAAITRAPGLRPPATLPRPMAATFPDNIRPGYRRSVGSNHHPDKAILNIGSQCRIDHKLDGSKNLRNVRSCRFINGT